MFLETFTFVSVNLSSFNHNPGSSKHLLSQYVFDAGSCRWDAPAFWRDTYVSFIWEMSFRDSTSWKMSAGMTKHLINCQGVRQRWLRAIHMQRVWKHFEKNSIFRIRVYIIWKHIFIRHILTYGSKTRKVLHCVLTHTQLRKASLWADFSNDTYLFQGFLGNFPNSLKCCFCCLHT